MGLSTAKLHRYLYEKDFQGDDNYEGDTSGIFRKYARGECSFKKDSRPAKKIEEKFRGATEILVHPIWFILENPHCDQQALHLNMQSLDPSVRSILCVSRKNNDVYPRRKKTHATTLYRLDIKNSLDALACILMIVREMQILKRWDSYIHAKWFAHWLFFRLSYFEPYKTVADKLYKIIYCSFIGNNDSLPDRNADSFFFYGDLTPPPFVNDRKQINTKFSDILLNAEKHNLSAKDIESKLKLLFWCCTLGIDSIQDALSSHTSTPQSTAFIKKLTSAYTSSDPESHFPNRYIIDFYGPFCLSESALDKDHHLYLLGTT